MEPVNNPLGGEIERSLSRGLDSLFGCGTGTILLFLLLILSLVMIAYLVWRNNTTVNMVLKALVGGEHENDKEPG